MPLIQAHQIQEQADLYEFKTSLLYKTNSRPARDNNETHKTLLKYTNNSLLYIKNLNNAIIMVNKFEYIFSLKKRALGIELHRYLEEIPFLVNKKQHSTVCNGSRVLK